MSSTSPPDGSRKAFTLSALALFLLIVGTNMPSPLYTVYAARFGFSPLVLTLVFATYAGALIPALLLSGSAADAWGYRRVLLPGVGVAVAGALVFAFADGTGWLFAGRALQGASTGMSSGALTAALARTEPSGSNRRASLLASLATTAGGGFGPVLAGACAAWLPAPTRTCYLFETGALIVVMAGLLTLPSALGRTGSPWRAALPHLPAAARASFVKACAVSFTGWAVTAVFLSVVPSYVRSLTGSHDLVLAGLSAGLLLLTAAVTQPLAARAAEQVLQRAGLVIMAAGLAVLLLAGSTGILALVIAAALLAGAGQGLAFMGAVRQANRLAPEDTRAAAISAFYVATYLGVGIPVIGVGLLATVTTTTTAVNVFAAIAILASITVAVLSRSARPARDPMSLRLRGPNSDEMLK